MSLDHLTRAERDVLHLLADQLSVADIAAKLALARADVVALIRSALEKLERQVTAAENDKQPCG